MNGRHKTFHKTEIVVDDFRDGREAVRRAGSVGNNLHVLGVFVKVDAANEHRSVGRRSGDDDFLRAADKVSGRLFGRGVDTGRFGNVLGAATLPIDVGSRHLREDLDLVAVHDQHIVLFIGRDLTVELAMDRIIAKHIDHIVEIDERIVDTDNLDVFSAASSAEDQTTDPTKTVNTYFNHKTTSI